MPLFERQLPYDPAIINLSQLELDRLHEMQEDWHLTAYLAKHDLGKAIDRQRVFESWIRHILSKLESRRCLGRKYLRSIRRKLISKAYPLLLQNSVESIGLFMTPQSFDILPIGVRVKSFVNVSTCFYLVPIYALFSERNKYFLVDVQEDKAKLYEGYYHQLEEVQMISFRKDPHISSVVNLANLIRNYPGIYDHPLVIACGHQFFEEFDMLIRHQQLLHCPVLTEVDHVLSKLHTRSNHMVRSLLKETVSALLRRSSQLVKKGKVALNFGRICRSANQGIVDELFLSEDLFLRGRIGKDTHLAKLDRNDTSFVDQQLAASVYGSGGQVYLAASEVLSNARCTVLATLR